MTSLNDQEGGQRTEMPIICGKPNPFVIGLICKEHNIMQDSEGIPLEKMVMIGDNLHTDIRLGSNAKIDTCLVLTGVSPSAEYVKEQVNLNTEVKAPTYIM
jgi:ribonucleotide monophosphatase NagD (HAD superfamily)